MESLRVLITNVKLEARTGTELYVRDLACGLLERGHSPVVYSPRLGALAAEIRRETVPVVDDLSKLSAPPDIIHGQHANETLTALLHFAGVPAVFFCHDWYFAEDFPPPFPRLLRYVAVDATCRDKLVFEHGVPNERVRLLYQFVDLERFEPRPSPLPAPPRRAVVLCNYTTEGEHLAAARAACARAGLTLDVYGQRVGRPCAEPEKLFRDYEIVFAKGRAALEALAVGASVVVYWWRRLGPLVTSAELERLRRDNFGIRAMGEQLTPEEFGREVERAVSRYDPADTAEVSRRVRETSGRERSIEEVCEVYEEVVEEYRRDPRQDFAAEARAAAAHLRAMSTLFWKQRETIYGSTPFRLTERVLRTPVLGRLTRAVARVAAGKDKR
ncbi:MAG TPA: glycosyltransferase family 4 protein [Pyrinomonadaceae bacterium]|nr:glycosyltransferase family 4 protein [Pyrinomonadaceae bacterium]